MALYVRMWGQMDREKTGFEKERYMELCDF